MSDTRSLGGMGGSRADKPVPPPLPSSSTLVGPPSFPRPPLSSASTPPASSRHGASPNGPPSLHGPRSLSGRAMPPPLPPPRPSSATLVARLPAVSPPPRKPSSDPPSRSFVSTLESDAPPPSSSEHVDANALLRGPQSAPGTATPPPLPSSGASSSIPGPPLASRPAPPPPPRPIQVSGELDDEGDRDSCPTIRSEPPEGPASHDEPVADLSADDLDVVELSLDDDVGLDVEPAGTASAASDDSDAVQEVDDAELEAGPPSITAIESPSSERAASGSSPADEAPESHDLAPGSLLGPSIAGGPKLDMALSVSARGVAAPSDASTRREAAGAVDMSLDWEDDEESTSVYDKPDSQAPASASAPVPAAGRAPEPASAGPASDAPPFSGASPLSDALPAFENEGAPESVQPRGARSASSMPPSDVTAPSQRIRFAPPPVPRWPDEALRQTPAPTAQLRPVRSPTPPAIDDDDDDPPTLRADPATVQAAAALLDAARDAGIGDHPSRTAETAVHPAIASVPPAVASAPASARRGRSFAAIAAFAAAAAVAAIGATFWTSRTGELRVDAVAASGESVPKVEVFVDGQKQCDTVPCVVRDVEPGERLVQVVAPGYETIAARPAQVEAGGEHDLSLELTPALSSLVAASAQPGVQLWVDGNARGPLPASLDDLAPGEHELRFEAGPRYEPLTRHVELEAGESLDLGQIRLEVASGLIRVDVEDDDAKVFVVTGEGDDKRTKALSGPWPRTLEVDADEPVTIVGKRKDADDFVRRVDFADGIAEVDVNITADASEPEPEPADSVAAKPLAASSAPASAKKNDEQEPSSAPAEPEAPKATKLGMLNVNSIPVSRVLVDGQPQGSTPRIGIELPAGVHTVTFVHPELGQKTMTVNVKPGQTARATVKLRDD